MSTITTFLATLDAPRNLPSVTTGTPFAKAPEVDPMLVKLAEVHDKVREKSWQRPFAALVLMGSEARDRIRLTLDFDWDKDTTLHPADRSIRAAFEAWEIIDCNVRGIVGRMHTMVEQLNPFRYMSWRKVLMRTLELHGQRYLATDSEEVLERVVLEALADARKRTARGQAKIPKFGFNKKAGLVADIIRDVSEGWDDLLDSQEEEAFSAIHAICDFIARDGQDAPDEDVAK